MNAEEYAQYCRAARSRGARSRESLDRSLDRRYGGGEGETIHVTPPNVRRSDTGQSESPRSSSTPNRRQDSHPPLNDRQHQRSQNIASGTRGRSRSRGIRRERLTRMSASDRASIAMEALYDREGKFRSELLRLTFVKTQIEAQAAAQKIKTLAAEEVYWTQKARNETNLLNQVPVEPYTPPVLPTVSTDVILTQTFEEWVVDKFPPNTFDRFGLCLGIPKLIKVNSETLFNLNLRNKMYYTDWGLRNNQQLKHDYFELYSF